MENNSLNKDVENLTLDSWSKNTKIQYKTYIEQWKKLRKEQNNDLQSASIAEGTEFLLLLHKKILGYSAINTARNMLSVILKKTDSIEFGKRPIVTRMLKEIFRNRQALPRYIATYDADLALRFLQSLPTWKEISLNWLILKTVTLIALLSGHRCLPINSLSLDHKDVHLEKVAFYIPKLFKNTTQAFHSKPIRQAKGRISCVCVSGSKKCLFF